MTAPNGAQFDSADDEINAFSQPHKQKLKFVIPRIRNCL
jgi:hypothetical protein